jgi:hypothetical protein
LVITKSGVTPKAPSKLGLAIRTRDPAAPLATLVVVSTTTMGLAPFASQTRSLPPAVRFWPARRIRSCTACRVVSPLTPPITCSICMKWNVAKAGEVMAIVATLIKSRRRGVFNLMDAPPGKGQEYSPTRQAAV